MSNAFEDLLLQNLRTLTDSVDELRSAQSEMKDALHEAMTANSDKLVTLEVRVASVESGMKTLKVDMRKQARRWGAIGGAAGSIAGIALALLKSVFGVKG